MPQCNPHIAISTVFSFDHTEKRHFLDLHFWAWWRRSSNVFIFIFNFCVEWLAKMFYVEKSLIFLCFYCNFSLSWNKRFSYSFSFNIIVWFHYLFNSTFLSFTKCLNKIKTAMMSALLKDWRILQQLSLCC